MTGPIDGGWAWVVLFSSFMCLLLTCGALYSVGVFNVAFLETFGANSAMTSWVGSVLIGLLALLGPVSSYITNRYGWRICVVAGGAIAGVGTVAGAWSSNIHHMFVCFGIISGIGHGLVYTPAVVVVGYYFDRFRTAATGVASVGAGISMLLFPPLLQRLISAFSWRECLVICGCIYLHMCLFGMLMRPLSLPLPPEVDDNQSEFEDVAIAKARARSRRLREKAVFCRCSSDGIVFLSRHEDGLAVCRFVIFCCSIFLAGLGLSTVYLHLPAYAISKGASKEEASLYVSIIGGLSITSRIFTGLAGNDKNIDNIVLYLGTFGIAGVFTLLFPQVGHIYWGRVVFSVAFGYYGSCFNVLLTPITVELVGLTFLTTAFGVLMVLCGTGYLLGPPLAGWLYDMTDTYDSSFYMAGTCLVASSVVMMTTALCTKRKRFCKRCRREIESMLFRDRGKEELANKHNDIFGVACDQCLSEPNQTIV